MSDLQQTVSDDSSKPRMAYVLFMDIVGYSLLPMDGQREILSSLQRAVTESPEFEAAQVRRRIVKLPTGDGMALVFFDDVEAAARCSIEICRAVRLAQIPLRIGLHYGPVYTVADINEQLNVTGGGINVAQRIMDCGDAGHILASQSVADVLTNLSAWSDYLHELGEVKVKHQLSVRLYNLYIENVGNAELPVKVKVARETQKKRARRKTIMLVALSVFVLGAVYLGVWFKNRYYIPEISEGNSPMLSKSVFNWRVENWDTVLHKGMRREEVQRLFGRPDSIFSINGVETWFYGPGSIQFYSEPRAQYTTVYSWHAPDLSQYLLNPNQKQNH